MVEFDIAPSVETSTDTGIPMTEGSKLGIFINRKNLSSRVTSLDLKLSKNNIPTADIVIDRYDAASTDISIGNYVVITYGALAWQGVLEKPATASRDTLNFNVRLIGKEGKDANRSIVAKDDYVDVDSASIVSDLFTDILTLGNNDSVGGATVRIDNTDCFSVVNKIVDDLGMWWKIEHPPPSAGTDYKEETTYNIYNWENASLYPEKNNPHYRPFTVGNCTKISSEFDIQQAVNYLRLLGSGDGRDQLESICTHATLNRSKLSKPMDTWLTQDAPIGTSLLYVTNTEGFPASGTLDIDGEVITYSSLSTSTTIVCTPTLQAHASDAEVINIEPDAIYLVDSSLFPDGGDVWIGNEKISYDTNDTANNKLTTNITRATTATDRSDTYKPAVKFYYAHGRNAPVWDAQYEPTKASAQTGSSINLYDLLATVESDSTIIDQNALDVAAGTVIDLYHDPPETVTLEMSSLIPLNHVELGDMIRIEDANYSGVEGNYRVYELNVRKTRGAPQLTIVAGNYRKSYTKDQAQTKRELGNLSVYAQGVPQTITINNYDNCDSGFPLEVKFPIPDAAISVNKIILNYTVADYRRYFDSSTPSGGSTTTTWNEAGDIVEDSDDAVTSFLTLTQEDWTTVHEFANVGESGQGILIRLNGLIMDPGVLVNAASYTNWLWKWRIMRTNGTAVYYPSVTGARMGINWDTHDHGGAEDIDYGNAAASMDLSILIPEDPVGLDYEIQIYNPWDNAYVQEYTGSASYEVHGQHSHNCPNHTHGVTYSIAEVGKSCTDITISIDDGNGYIDRTAAIEADLGTSLSTSEIRELDLTKYFGDTSGWKGIQIEPDDKCRIEGALYAKYFETNRT